MTRTRDNWFQMHRGLIEKNFVRAFAYLSVSMSDNVEHSRLNGRWNAPLLPSSPFPPFPFLPLCPVLSFSLFFFDPSLPPTYTADVFPLYANTYIRSLSPTPYMYRTPVQWWIRTEHENIRGKKGGIDSHHCASHEYKTLEMEIVSSFVEELYSCADFVKSSGERKPTIILANVYRFDLLIRWQTISRTRIAHFANFVNK